MTVLRHEFVEFIPDELASNTIYISISFATVAHRCCCGCGNEVVTPLSPADWQLTFDGETMSLHPSIGNWSFPCQSHYWIVRNSIRWAEQWSEERIAAGRVRDAVVKQHKYREIQNEPRERANGSSAATNSDRDYVEQSLLARLRRWLAG